MALDGAVELVNSIAGAPAPGPRILISGSAEFEKRPQGSRRVEDDLQVLAREGVEALTPRLRSLVPWASRAEYQSSRAVLPTAIVAPFTTWA